MLTLLTLLSTASAQSNDAVEVDEEILVYDDLFARWRGTRWLVETELMTPLGTWLAEDTNRGVTSYAFQVRMVLACDEEARLGRRRLEVRCAIEDLSLQATTFRHHGTAPAQEAAAGVLEAVDAMLTDADLQLQVDHRGGVGHVDIEGLTARNERQRAAHEELRQLMKRTMAGFHLRLPDQAQRPGQELERHSELMAVPSLTGNLGSSRLVHQVSRWNGYHLVQTQGTGTATASVPAPPRVSEREVLTGDEEDYALDGLASGEGAQRATLLEKSTSIQLLTLGGAPPRTVPTAPPPENLVEPPPRRAPNGDGGVLDLDLTYAMSASGVALYEHDTGILFERVWTVEGHPTAGSAGGSVHTIPFRNVGHLRRLADDETPDLGPTAQVSPPGLRITGLEDWTPLDPVAVASTQ